MSRDFTPPHECPVCGETVPRGAKACPGCGADGRSGWDEEATRYDGLDLPDEAFKDDHPCQVPTESKLIQTVVIVVTIAALLLFFVF